ncbi:hypothetical protein JNK13_08075 [bacterium]|nr:hypothetical protein [bacterium]
MEKDAEKQSIKTWLQGQVNTQQLIAEERSNNLPKMSDAKALQIFFSLLNFGGKILRDNPDSNSELQRLEQHAKLRKFFCKLPLVK